ncbi:helix-turn-helix domain-containing protein [Rhizobium sp. WYJ-E13]|uniref:helix-turn-helix domain-containing protein n=1 Tax=Rhizobium sp. WYJ-E13 TaxID=2849093 RepID=UPI001C1ED3F2|nr:helix-turn-helix domain-containing protein [Rhizobium sp. WYJ-E13]QWW72582.1 helix-turn-helix domain-containing protein [Rhizobium sp. WYJ-E13]
MKKSRSSNSTSSTAMRALMQDKGSSVRAVARDLGVSPTTVQKWRQRQNLTDAPAGPKSRQLALTPKEEAIVILTRWFGLFSLDDCLLVLGQFIPRLRRSSLHRCFQRHGIARSPDKVAARFQHVRPAHCFRIAATMLAHDGHVVWLCIAIDGRSRFALVDFCESHMRVEGILHELIRRFPANLTGVTVQAGPSRDDNNIVQFDVSSFGKATAKPFKPWKGADLAKLEIAIQAGLGPVACRNISTLRRAARRYSRGLNRGVSRQSRLGCVALDTEEPKYKP